MHDDTMSTDEVLSCKNFLPFSIAAYRVDDDGHLGSGETSPLSSDTGNAYDDSGLAFAPGVEVRMICPLVFLRGVSLLDAHLI